MKIEFYSVFDAHGGNCKFTPRLMWERPLVENLLKLKENPVPQEGEPLYGGTFFDTEEECQAACDRLNAAVQKELLAIFEESKAKWQKEKKSF